MNENTKKLSPFAGLALVIPITLCLALSGAVVLAQPDCNQPRDVRTWSNPNFPYSGVDMPGCTSEACPEEVSFDSAETVNLCPHEGCCDSISTSGIPDSWHLVGLVDIQYAFTGACDDMGNVLYPPFNRISIQQFPIDQTGDLNLNFCYPRVGDWLSFEIHVDVAIQVTDTTGASVGWVGGDQVFAAGTIGPGGQDWDLFCFGTGCTPGFWKNHLEVWPDRIPGFCSAGFCTAGNLGGLCGTSSDCDVPLSTDDLYCDVFGLSGDPACPDPTLTLLGAVNANGNKDGQALLRHSVAALLNTVNADGAACGFNYGFGGSAESLIAAVAAAWMSGDTNTLKNELVVFNESICPGSFPAPWLGGFGDADGDGCFDFVCNPNF